MGKVTIIVESDNTPTDILESVVKDLLFSEPALEEAIKDLDDSAVETEHQSKDVECRIYVIPSDEE